MNEYKYKQLTSIKMLVDYYFPVVVGKWPPSLGVVYFLLCEVAVASPPSDVKFKQTDNKMKNM